MVSSELRKDDTDEDSAIPRSQWETLHYLRDLGFLVNDHIKRFDDFDALITYVIGFEAHRHDLDFEIDGLVIKIDDIPTANALGIVGKNPRGAVAYKFRKQRDDINPHLSLFPTTHTLQTRQPKC